MVTEKELSEIERRMEEEHRKDREALQRLKRFLHQGTAPAPIEHVDAEYIDVEDKAQTIIGKVEDVFASDIAKRWTIHNMVVFLKSQKFPLVAQKPDATMGLIFSKLQKRGKIRIVRKGSGRLPNIYRATVPKEVGAGDDQNERATQGQPVAFQ